MSIESDRKLLVITRTKLSEARFEGQAVYAILQSFTTRANEVTKHITDLRKYEKYLKQRLNQNGGDL